MTEQKGKTGEETVPAPSAEGSVPAQTVAAPASDETVLSESQSTAGPSETIPTAVSGGVTVAEPAEVAAAEQAVAAEWAEGDVILDLYEVKGLLGEGGMGKVYLVRHRGWNLDLAVKSPRADYFQTEEQKQNFVRECETWIDLGLHPHTVSCYYVRTLGGIPRVFAEYVEGGSLSDWIESGKLYEGGEETALRRMLDVAIQFAWGLGYAHERGLIHQDVKPANVMLTPEGEAKVTDFGLAQARPAAEVEISDGKGGTVLVKGRGLMTPAYCSPEQAAGEKLSRKTDVWSWGVSALEMFVGERTWEHGQAASLVLESYPEAEQEDKRVPRMPKRVAELLGQCFAHEPSERPQDMSVVVERLKECYRAVVGEEYGRPEPKPAELLADALNNRAVSLLDLGRREEAEKLFDEALKSDPHHVEATYNRGLVLWRSGRMTDDVLVKQLEEVRTTHEADWRDEYYLGLVHIERGNAEAAAKVLEEAAETTPDERELKQALSTAMDGGSKWHASVRVMKSPSEGVTSVSISPDGRCGLSGSWDKTLRLWELATGSCVHVFKAHRGVNSVAITPNGRWGLSGSWDKTLRLWELATGQCVRVFEGHTEHVQSVATSMDGRYALSGCWDDTLRLWEIATGKCIRVFQCDRAPGEVFYSVAVSPDSRWGLSGSTNGWLRLWELQSGRCVRVFKGHGSGANSVAISPNGRRALSGSGDSTLRLWELATGECVRVMKGHSGGVQSVAFSQEGRWALSGSGDSTLRLWELATGRCLRTFEGHNMKVTCVSTSPDGRWVLSSSWDGTLRLWELKGTGPAAQAAIRRPRTSAEEIGANTEIRRALESATSALGQGDARRAATEVMHAWRIPGYERHQGLLGMWFRIGLRGKRKGLRGAWGRRTFDGSYGSSSISPDGHWVFSGCSDGELRLWELATGKCVRTICGHDNTVMSVSISPDGRWGLSRSFTGGLHLWELATRTPVRVIPGDIFGSTSPDWRLALSGGRQTMQLWELVGPRINAPESESAAPRSLSARLHRIFAQASECMRAFEHPGLVKSAAFGPDGRCALSACNDGNLRLWELATGRHVRVLKGHQEAVLSVAISPDGRWALSGSADKTLRFWELVTGKCVRVLKGHQDEVKCVTISPDGWWGLSGSGDKTVRIWELATGRCARTVLGHTRSVRSVGFSPDGRWALSAGGDMRLWELVWDYDFPDPADWDEGARPYLQIFLTLHCPYGDDGISRVDKPSWGDEDLARLVKDLQYRGYGWLRPEGVRRELEKMTREWEAS